MTTSRPNLFDVLSARKRIDPYIARTPLHLYTSLEKILDA